MLGSRFVHDGRNRLLPPAVSHSNTGRSFRKLLADLAAPTLAAVAALARPRFRHYRRKRLCTSRLALYLSSPQATSRRQGNHIVLESFIGGDGAWRVPTPQRPEIP